MDCVWDAAGIELEGEGVGRSGCVAVHRAIDDADSPFHFISAHLVIKSHDLLYALLPYRPVRTAYSLDIQTVELLQGSLYGIAILSYYI